MFAFAGVIQPPGLLVMVYMIAPPQALLNQSRKSEGLPAARVRYRAPSVMRHTRMGKPIVQKSIEPEDWEHQLDAIARRSDRVAFEKLFLHFGPRIKAYLMKLGSESNQAEDLMQDVMAQVWRKSTLFDKSKAGAATWIFTIARNLRIDSFRRDKRPAIDENDPALVPEAEVPADETLHFREVANRLRGILETLPEEQRIVVLMSLYEDKAHAAIADELGLPLGTVKSRLRLAMVKIKDVWGDGAGVRL